MATLHKDVLHALHAKWQHAERVRSNTNTDYSVTTVTWAQAFGFKPTSVSVLLATVQVIAPLLMFVRLVRHAVTHVTSFHLHHHSSSTGPIADGPGPSHKCQHAMAGPSLGPSTGTLLPLWTYGGLPAEQAG